MKYSPLKTIAQSVTPGPAKKGKIVYFLLRNNKITVSIDTGYHAKRGYRKEVITTSIKETLAAACKYTKYISCSVLRFN